MGAAVADLDDDGVNDLGISLNFYIGRYQTRAVMPLADVTLVVGVIDARADAGLPMIPWGIAYVDLDQDGRVDQVVAHGNDHATMIDPTLFIGPHRMTANWNAGGFHFADVSRAMRLDRRGRSGARSPSGTSRATATPTSSSAASARCRGSTATTSPRATTGSPCGSAGPRATRSASAPWSTCAPGPQRAAAVSHRRRGVAARRVGAAGVRGPRGGDHRRAGARHVAVGHRARPRRRCRGHAARRRRAAEHHRRSAVAARRGARRRHPAHHAATFRWQRARRRRGAGDGRLLSARAHVAPRWDGAAFVATLGAPAAGSSVVEVRVDDVPSRACARASGGTERLRPGGARASHVA